MSNAIYLRRKNKMMISNGDAINEALTPAVMSMAHDASQLGYLFDMDLVDALRTLREGDLKAIHTELIGNLKKMVGAHVKYEPMYPNFPTQVMEASDAELWINAMMHYLGDAIGARIMPVYEEEARPLLDEKVKYKIIKLGNHEDFMKIFTNLVGAKTSISEQDKEDLTSFIVEYGEDVFNYLPSEITFKENMSYITGELMAITDKLDNLFPLFKTATDVLRLAVSLSDGDVSLADNTKFRKFTRKEPRLLLAMLNNCKNPTEDMLRYKNRWIRLGEILHPGEYKARYKKAYDSFDILRNNKPYQTFNSKVEMGLLQNDAVGVAELLKSRPGELARRLDHIVRISHDRAKVIKAFNQVADQINVPLLMQVMNHFKIRNIIANRVVFPKGSLAKAKVIESTPKTISTKMCDSIASICKESILKQLGERDDIGKVFIDDNLSQIVVPFSQRSASSNSMRTIPRGSRIALEENGKTVRFFIYWKDIKDGRSRDRVDLDLSAVIFDSKWGYKEHVSYTNLRSAGYSAYHSGDITSAPAGACEFIDIDIDAVANAGGRYIIMNVLSYTGQPFTDMPEAFAGWMIREKVKSGKIFEPKTVQDKFDLTADTKVSIPLIIDCVKKEVIWTDMALGGNPNWRGDNVEGNMTGIAATGYALTEMRKPNLYDLFEMHVDARGGELVESKEDADVVFSMDADATVTPFDVDTIVGEYL